MSNSKNNISFIKIIGSFIIVIFFFILAINILPIKENNNYNIGLTTNSVISNQVINSNIEKINNTKITSLSIENKKLKIVVDDGISEYCIKTTKTTPSINNICWKKFDNNVAYTAIYTYKIYYIWTKDNKGNISNFIGVDSNKLINTK